MVFFVVFWGAPGRRQLARKWFLRGIGNTNNIQGSSLNEIFKILYKMCPLPKPTLLVYQNSRPVYLIIKSVQVEDLLDHLHQGGNPNVTSVRNLKIGGRMYPVLGTSHKGQSGFKSLGTLDGTCSGASF